MRFIRQIRPIRFQSQYSLFFFLELSWLPIRFVRPATKTRLVAHLRICGQSEALFERDRVVGGRECPSH